MSRMFDYNRSIKEVSGVKREDNKLFLGLKDRKSQEEDSFLFVVPVENTGERSFGVEDLYTGDYFGGDLDTTSSSLSDDQMSMVFQDSNGGMKNKYLYCMESLEDRERRRDEIGAPTDKKLIQHIFSQIENNFEDEEFFVSDAFLDDHLFGMDVLDLMEEEDGTVIKIAENDLELFNDNMITKEAITLNSLAKDMVLPYFLVSDCYGYVENIDRIDNKLGIVSNTDYVVRDNFQSVLNERLRWCFPHDFTRPEKGVEYNEMLPFDLILSSQKKTSQRVRSYGSGVDYKRVKIIFDRNDEYSDLKDFFFENMIEFSEKRILNCGFSCLAYYKNKMYVSKEPLSVFSFCYDLKENDTRLSAAMNFLVLNVFAINKIYLECLTPVYLIPFCFSFSYDFNTDNNNVMLQMSNESIVLLKSCFSKQRYSGYSVDFSFEGRKHAFQNKRLRFQVDVPYKTYWSLKEFVYLSSVNGRRYGVSDNVLGQWSDLSDTIWLKFGTTHFCTGVLHLTVRIFIHYIP